VPERLPTEEQATQETDKSSDAKVDDSLQLDPGEIDSGGNLAEVSNDSQIVPAVITLSGNFQKVESLLSQGAEKLSSFGYDIAMDGNTLVVGSLDDGAKGAVYVFEKVSDVWTFKQRLVATTPMARQNYDDFGKSVDISGDTIVIGAPNEDVDETGANQLNSSGSVHVFVLSNGQWVFQKKITGHGPNGRHKFDRFGTDVAIELDTLVVGAPQQDFDGSGTESSRVESAGAAFVYRRSNGVWALEQRLVPQGKNARITEDEFGNAVAISGDTIAVGVLLHDYDENGENFVGTESGFDEDGNEVFGDSGAVFIFSRFGSTWVQEQKIVGVGLNGRASEDYFGANISLDGDTLAVGAHGQASDENGQNIKKESITEEGQTFEMIDRPGAVFVFLRANGLWTLQQKLVGQGVNGRMANDGFGKVALQGDTLVVGAGGQDFDENGANIKSGTGAAYVYTRSNSQWSFQKKIVRPDTRNHSDFFGKSVAVSGDTIGIAVGGHPIKATAVYLFK
jgi:trimeric autotransporter adhesin